MPPSYDYANVVPLDVAERVTRFQRAMPEPSTATAVVMRNVLPLGVIALQRDDVAAQIYALAALTEGSSSQRPNDVAIRLALGIAAGLRDHGREPYLVAPIAGGGVSLRFRFDERHARVEADNDGEIVIVMQATSESAPQYDGAEGANQTTARLAEFFGE